MQMPMLRDLHEQTGLTAGTIAHDDELATDLGHLQGRNVSFKGSEFNQRFHKQEKDSRDGSRWGDGGKGKGEGSRG